MKRCPSCSTPFADTDATFCEACGEVLVSEAAVHRATTARALAATMPVAPPPPGVRVVTKGEPLAHTLEAAPFERLVAVAGQVLDMASLFDQAGLLWAPQPEDFVVDGGGGLAITQARGVGKRLGAFDTRWILRALGEALSPVPLALAPTSFLRLLLEPKPEPMPLVVARERLARSAVVSPAGAPGAALDVGFSRERQEDAVLVTSEGDARMVVVCDGVSLSADGALASSVGVEAAMSFVRLHANEPGRDDAKTAVEAIRRAHVVVCERAGTFDEDDAEDDDQDPPGSTIVVAIVRGTRASIAWLGDSRAYVVSDGSAELVTRDHSWKNEIERMGYEPPAGMGAMGSALTRCIGPLEGGLKGDVEPDVEVRELAAGSTLVVCTDGMWGYFPEAEQMGDVVRANAGATENELAVRMVNLALVCGGEDNVTVAVVRSPISR